MPNPSVPLCSANPMTKMVARPISPVAALPPMARPSPKLCSPMPTAISRDRRRAVDQPEMPRGAASSCGAIVPGPKDGDEASPPEARPPEAPPREAPPREAPPREAAARAREPSQPS